MLQKYQEQMLDKEFLQKERDFKLKRIPNEGRFFQSYVRFSSFVVNNIEKDTSGNNSQKLIEISNSLQGLNFHLVETFGSIRKFLKEGNMKKLTSKGKKMTVHFYLFNDMLIYAKPANIGKNYIYRAKYSLQGATAVVLNDSTSKLSC